MSEMEKGHFWVLVPPTVPSLGLLGERGTSGNSHSCPLGNTGVDLLPRPLGADWPGG